MSPAWNSGYLSNNLSQIIFSHIRFIDDANKFKSWQVTVTIGACDLALSHKVESARHVADYDNVYL